jgi:transcriptional regulator with XRE-family HTH domain
MINGPEIKRRRELLGLSQAQFAKVSGLSQQSLSRLERNGSIGTRNIGKLATALGCRIEDLDPDFSGLSASTETALPSEVTVLLNKLARKMKPKLGFLPNELQVIQHLLVTSPYRDT